MSDQDIRRILGEVIADIDAGRVVVPRPRGFRLGALLAGPALAASMMLAGCERAQPAYGVPPMDGQVSDAALDGGPDAIYMAPWDAAVDGGQDATLDDGAVVEYGAPPDSGTQDGAVDGGSVPLYMGPPPSA